MPYKDPNKAKEYHERPEQREKAKIRARKWAEANPKQSRDTKEKYYNTHRKRLLENARAYLKKHPHINKLAVEKWRKNNIDKDPVIYRVSGKLRQRCIELWGNECSICGREFEAKGFLKRIFHHIQYSPTEHIVLLCYQCHNLIHGRRCYSHPFLKLFKENAPEYIAHSIINLRNKYIVLHRLIPRKCGGNRKKEAQIFLHEDNALDLDLLSKSEMEE